MSPWERAARASERQAERERVSAQRRIERFQASFDRARERDLLRQEREEERARKLASKKWSAESARREAESSRAYFAALTCMHRVKFSSRRAHDEFAERLRPRSYTGNAFRERYFPERFQPLNFVPTPFADAGSFVASAHGRRLALVRSWTPVLPITTAATGLALGDLSTSGIAAGAGLASALGLWLWTRTATQRAFREEVDSARRQHEAAEELRRLTHESSETSRREAFDARVRAFNQAEWERHAAFDQHESSMVEIARRGEAERVEVLSAVQRGDLGAMAKVLEAALPLDITAETPEGFVGASLNDHEIGFRLLDPRRVELVVLAPSFDVVPDRLVELSASGEKTKSKVIPEKERQAMYNRLIGSLALAGALRVFTALPAVEEVGVEAGAMVLDGATGKPTERVVLRAKFIAAKLDEVNVELVDPLDVLRLFDHEVAPLGGKAVVMARIDRETITWAGRDDDLLDVPYGLVPEQRNTQLPPNPHA